MDFRAHAASEYDMTLPSFEHIDRGCISVLELKPQLIATSFELDGEHDTYLPVPKLLAELETPGNWSGKGQHVEFARDEAIPLEQGQFLGRGAFADVYEVKCRGFLIARKQIY